MSRTMTVEAIYLDQSRCMPNGRHGLKGERLMGTAAVDEMYRRPPVVIVLPASPEFRDAIECAESANIFDHERPML